MLIMMKKILVAPLGLMAILMVSTGCDSTKPNDNVAPQVLSVYPGDASVNIATDTCIVVTFDMPMDTVSCEVRFSAYEGVPNQMGHMMMHQQESIMGTFDWNEDHTEMTFHPEEMFNDSTMYTYHLEEGMEDHEHGSLMMSGMMPFGAETDDGIICTFTTSQSADNGMGEM